MGLRHLSDGLQLSQHDLGREASSTWLSTNLSPFFSIDTGHNDAGNGGSGYFSGDLIDSPYAAFEPQNIAQSGSHGSATAHQTNIAILDQSATQIAGIGGDGGDDNTAIGGSVSSSGGSGSIATGDDSAGVGGDGVFQGAMVHAPVAVFSPVNIAVAGAHGNADAHQSNSAQFYQPSFQFAGNGGSAGDGNTAAGGGNKLGSDEALAGLARAFFYAGARALLVSQWAVDSQATVAIVTKAFDEIKSNSRIGRAEALRRSMLALIASGGSNAHPANWAPFVVVGEGAR